MYFKSSYSIQRLKPPQPVSPVCLPQQSPGKFVGMQLQMVNILEACFSRTLSELYHKAEVVSRDFAGANQGDFEFLRLKEEQFDFCFACETSRPGLNPGFSPYAPGGICARWLPDSPVSPLLGEGDVHRFP